MELINSVEERLQVRREPLDKWSLREQLCLASAVARSGDQNWMSVSRALKPFGESNRPSDWFHQKNCAAQYGALLANVETPKRKKRSGSSESVVETPAECILRRLLADRQAELKQQMAEEKAEYRKLQEDMKLLHSGRVTEEQLDIWCKEIDEEESKREQEAINHAKWLKHRELKKQEIERNWRPVKTSPFPVVGQKRKMSDMMDNFIESNDLVPPQTATQQYLSSLQQQKPAQYTHQVIDMQSIQQQQESVKPAFSPLLTSLLKSPSQVHNLAPVLQNAVTNNTKPLESTPSNSDSNPTIAGLLSNVSMEALDACDINSFVANNLTNEDSSQPLDADLLDDANLKIDDLAKSILVQDGPFPEIKKEEVDDIISEIIESAHDIVTDPEQHLDLDGNGDINISLEMEDELDQEDALLQEEMKANKEDVKAVEEKVPSVVDPFEFQEDPVMFNSPVKPSSLKQEGGNTIPQYMSLYQLQSPVKNEDNSDKKTDAIVDDCDKTVELEKNAHGSVEIVEVVAAEEQENANELNKAQIQDIVHSCTDKQEPVEEDSIDVKEEHSDNEGETFKHESEYPEEKNISDDNESKVDMSNFPPENAAEFSDDLYDNVNMEVKIDKTGKTKRDYSRPKKKEEKGFDMLLAIEKAHLDDMSMSDDMAEFKMDDNQKKEKVENDDSTSPWTEEEDGKGKRRYSTPGTPLDSLPNSPASSVLAFSEDDKDYRNWKKSVMLVYNRLASNKYASLFLKPITDEQAPGYSSIVYRPMDLQTIKKNIDNGTIRNSLEFKRDVMLMFTNAIMYNKSNDTVYNMTLQMQQESMNPIEILLQAEGQVEAPVRRETRTSESSCKRKRMSEEPSKNKKKKED